MKRRWFAAFGVLLGCAAPKPAASTLDVRPVAWSDAPLGKVAAVAEADEVVTVFSDRGAIVLAGGVELAVDPTVRAWVSAATIPAADGNGTWMVGVAADGRVFRVRDRKRLELVSPRWGLGTTRVRNVVGLGDGRVIFDLAAGLALATAEKVTRYDYAFTAVHGGAGWGVGLEPDAVRVFDPLRGDRRFVVAATDAVVDAKGRLVVANAEAVWSERDGQLVLRHRATAALHGLASGGDRVWFADGPELGTVSDAGVSLSAGAKLAPTAKLVPATGDDVWTLAEGTLTRYSTAKGAGTFDAQVAPIARRVCAKCHGPGTMLELVERAQWEKARPRIEQRVVQERTMPPAGTPMTDVERAAIAAWARR